MRVFSISIFYFISFLFFVRSTSQAITLKKIRLGSQTLMVEVAEAKKDQDRGLSKRKFLKKDWGMLFVFSETKIQTFWMKDTWIPLSIGFFDKNKVLFEIKQMSPNNPKAFKTSKDFQNSQKSLPVYSSQKPATYALEVQRGWFRKQKISLGSKFKWLKFSLRPKSKIEP